MFGRVRSSFVIESTIASVRLSCFSSMERPRTLLMPGSMPRIFSSGPIRRIILNCARKSLKSNEAVRSLRSSLAASSISTASAALSTRVTTSPMPRIRPASRSGIKGSNSSSFSPVPANLIGRCVTSRIDKAAPPRASPSSFVRIIPVIDKAASKPLATLTACCPVAASATSKISCGRKNSFSALSSSISASSISCRPAVSKICTLDALAVGVPSSAAAAARCTFFSPGSGI